MKKEFGRIKKVSREIVGDHHFKKVKKIKDYKERTESLKYLVDSLLKLRLIDLESRIEGIERKEALIVESKVKLLRAKIKIFQSTYHSRDYEVIKKLIGEIEEELRNGIV